MTSHHKSYVVTLCLLVGAALGGIAWQAEPWASSLVSSPMVQIALSLVVFCLLLRRLIRGPADSSVETRLHVGPVQRSTDAMGSLPHREYVHLSGGGR